jgi:hypothetical protein
MKSEVLRQEAQCPDCGFPLSAMDEYALLEAHRQHVAYAHRTKAVHVDLTALAGVVHPESAK